MKLKYRGSLLLLAALVLLVGLWDVGRAQAAEYETLLSLQSTQVKGTKERAIPEEQRGEVLFKLWGRDLVLETDTPGKGGEVVLREQGEDSLFTFPLASMGPWLSVKRITLDSGREFLLVEKGLSSVSDAITNGFAIFGLRDGEIVQLAGLRELKEAGITGACLRAVQEVPGDVLWVQGTVRDRECRQYADGGRAVTYRYGDREVKPQKGWFWAIDAVSLSWDEAREEFSLTYHENPEP